MSGGGGSSSQTITPTEISANVKVFYDQSGKASEVLLSYELFLEILSYLPEADQAYFWTEEWQAKEQAADEANAEGRFKTFASMNEMLEFMNTQ